MHTQLVTREQVIELVQKMPLEKLAVWYEYGLFIQSHPLVIAFDKASRNEAALQEEFEEWEEASDIDLMEFEKNLEAA